MKRHLSAVLAAGLILGGAGAAAAQPGQWNGHDNNGRHHDNNGPGYGNHGSWNQNWRKGSRLDHNYWDHASRVDWRTRHLRRPPRGYEWREVNGNYVLAAVATGLIADLIINGR